MPRPGVWCLLAAWLAAAAADVAVDLSPEAVLPDGAREMNLATGKEPPSQLEATPTNALDNDGDLSLDTPRGTQLGPPVDYPKGRTPVASYDWVHELDMYSALLFNWKFYAAKYGLVNKTEHQVRADWKAHLEGGEKYPDCRQGQPLFSPNKYMENNVEIKKNVEGSCSGALASYLGQGVFEGATGDTGRSLRLNDRFGEPQLEIKLQKGFEVQKTAEWLEPSPEYTLTWWHKFTAAGGGSWRSVLHYGNAEALYPKSPSVLQYPSSLEEPNTRLSFIVGHTDDPDFSCDPEPQVPVNKWTYIALSVRRNGFSVFYDGNEVCAKTSETGGTTKVTSGQKMYLGDVFHPAAYAKLAKVTYYKNELMNSGMLKATMNLENKMAPLVEEEEGNDDLAEIA